MFSHQEQDAAFRQALHQAEEALSHDPNGELALPRRNALWLAMGAPQKGVDGNPTGPGWRRRVRLGLLTVQHLLPLWQTEYSQDQGPQRMLLLAEQVVSGRINSKTERAAASSESDDYWAAVSDLGVTEEGSTPLDVLPFCVGAAAARVVRTALTDYQIALFLDPDGDKTETDTDRDAWSWDESYLASMACAGGSAWAVSSSPQRRREFWRWWLTEAVPQAYQSVSG